MSNGLIHPTIQGSMKDALRRIDLLERRLQRLQKNKATRLDSFVLERSTAQNLVSSSDATLEQYITFDGGYRTPDGAAIASWDAGEPEALRIETEGVFIIGFQVSTNEDNSGQRGGARYADICVNDRTDTPCSAGPIAGNNMGSVDVHLASSINRLLLQGDKLYLRVLQNSGHVKPTGATPPPTLSVQFISADTVQF